MSGSVLCMWVCTREIFDTWAKRAVRKYIGSPPWCKLPCVCALCGRAWLPVLVGDCDWVCVWEGHPARVHGPAGMRQQPGTCSLVAGSCERLSKRASQAST